MARKRKGLEHLSYESQEYWNRVLAKEGLSMNRGYQPNKISYVGTSRNLEYIEGARRTDTGRTIPAIEAALEDENIR